MSFRFSTIVFGLHFRLQMRTRILLTNFSDVLIYLKFYDLSITKRFINSLSLYEVFKVQLALHTILSVFRAMETERFELSTPCLQGRCSPN